MKKRWMYLIAELAAMVILAVINKLQYRKDRRRGLASSPDWVREKNRKEYEESRPNPSEFHPSYRFEDEEPK